jgi:hypothetical protein
MRSPFRYVLILIWAEVLELKSLRRRLSFAIPRKVLEQLLRRCQ